MLETLHNENREDMTRKYLDQHASLPRFLAVLLFDKKETFFFLLSDSLTLFGINVSLRQH